MVKVTITRYRKGVLSIPSMYCPRIDTLTGALQLFSVGTMVIGMEASRAHIYQDLRLRTGARITDQSYDVIIATDDLGNIDELGRIDAPVTTPATSFIVPISPAMLATPTQSGTFSEGSGQWTINANDSLYLSLNAILAFKHLNSALKLEGVRVYMNSNNNGAYVDGLWLQEYLSATNIPNTPWNSTVDIGNGSIGNENGLYSPNYTLLVDNYHVLEVRCVVGAGTLIVRSLDFIFSLV